MAPELLIPLLIFVVLAAVLAVVLRRIGGVVAETRETTAFRHKVEELARRIDATLGDSVARIDALRRQQIDAADIAEPLQRALDALPGFGEEARRLGGPPVVAGSRAELAAEIDRAERALRMVEHGASILASASSGHRLTEGQTAVKRGYLNVLHARDAVARHAHEISMLRSPEELRWYSRRPAEGAAQGESRH